MDSAPRVLDRFPELLRRCRDARFEVDTDSGLFTIDEKHVEGIRQLLTDVVTLLGDIEHEYAADMSEGEPVALVDCSIADLSFLVAEEKQIVDLFSLSNNIIFEKFDLVAGCSGIHISFFDF